MNSTARRKKHAAIEGASRNAKETAGTAAAPRHAMHEIKRSILKKLSLRMNQDDYCCS
jgi:hypothetical protein